MTGVVCLFSAWKPPSGVPLGFGAAKRCMAYFWTSQRRQPYLGVKVVVVVSHIRSFLASSACGHKIRGSEGALREEK